MMNTAWQEFLVSQGARFDEAMVDKTLRDFGAPADELLAARDATVLAPLTHLALLECAGADAQNFLHNQLTSDVNHLSVDGAQYSAWCTAKGRMLASFLLYRQEEKYYVLLSSDLLSTTQKRLQSFVLRAKVTLTELSEQHVLLGIAGAQAELALQQAGLRVPPHPMTTTRFDNSQLIRLDTTRFLLVVENSQAENLWKTLAQTARPVGSPAWIWLDIQAKIPLITAATQENLVPQMANFDKIGGVSFNKGCYPGQEIVARAQYLGKVKRHLYQLRATSAVAPGDSIYAPDDLEHPCGIIVNAAPSPDGGFAALAVLQESLAETTGLCVISGGLSTEVSAVQLVD